MDMKISVLIWTHFLVRTQSDRIVEMGHKRAGPVAPHQPNFRAGAVETAAYIAELSGDLALLARRSGFDTLAYLLDIARLEADNIRASGGRRS